MPRNVRNFWIDLSVDGASKRIETGPRSKDGGFHLVILQRDNGGIIRAMEIDGRVMSDGRLKLSAVSPGSNGSLDSCIDYTSNR